MSAEFCLSLFIMASMSVARADVKRKLPFPIQTRQDCAHYEENCRFRTCCQYEGRSEIRCFVGKCLQAWCSLAGLPCTSGFRECCYDKGLSCLNGICSIEVLS
ncbi:hypothetical protein BsWGS_26018 [Bradybaena similaris]